MEATHMATKKTSKTLEDLFLETLKDMYYAEKKIVTALPKMAKAAQSAELGRAFKKHTDETENQISRLEQVFEFMEKKPAGKTCPAINGMVKEAQEIMKDFKGSPAHDAGLLSAAQAVEHYEISRYGTLCAWAEELGWRDVSTVLAATLSEEKQTDKKLTELAEASVNIEAEAA
jgi:ferritin-like metal-binding protein YciE